MGGQARTDVFKLAWKVKQRGRGGETSPTALLLSSKILPGSELTPPHPPPPSPLREVSPDRARFHHMTDTYCAGAAIVAL